MCDIWLLLYFRTRERCSRRRTAFRWGNWCLWERWCIARQTAHCSKWQGSTRYDSLDRGVARGRGQGSHAQPIVNWVDFFTEENWLCWTVLSTRSVLWASNMPKTPPPQFLPTSVLSAPRFSRLRRSASVAPQCKILATPLSLDPLSGTEDFCVNSDWKQT